MRRRQARIDQLATGEELYVTLELTNLVSKMAVQIQTTDYHMVGWAPRYLVADLSRRWPKLPNILHRCSGESPARAVEAARIDSDAWQLGPACTHERPGIPAIGHLKAR